MILGERVKKLRNSLGSTQKEFASHIPGKINRAYICGIERGKQYPSLRLLERIGKTYAVPLSYFFEDNWENRQEIISYVQLLNWLYDILGGWEKEAEQHLKEKNYLGYGASKSMAVQTRAMIDRIIKKAIKYYREGGE